jgi:hypothetical protein
MKSDDMSGKNRQAEFLRIAPVKKSHAKEFNDNYPIH